MSFSRVFIAEPVIFSLLGRTSSILRTFRAEPVKTRSSSACHVGPLALETLIIFEQF